MTDSEQAFRLNAKALDSALSNALSKLSDQNILHKNWSSERDWPVWKHELVQETANPPETARVSLQITYYYPERSEQSATLEFSERIEIFQMGAASRVLIQLNDSLLISNRLLQELDSEIRRKLQIGWERLEAAGWKNIA